MKKTFIQLLSKNRITFHHSTTILNANTQGVLSLESHYASETLYLISGSAEYIIDGKTYKLYPGDVILLPPNTLHSMKVNPDTPYERMVLHLPPDLLPVLQDLDIMSIFNTAESFAYVIPKIFVDKSDIPNLFNEICKNCRTPDDKYIDLRILSIFYKLVEEFNLTVTKLKESTDFKPNVSISNNNVYACTQYISQHLSSPLTVNEIAAALHVSPSHLAHIFKKEIGVSLKKYVTLQKLYLASKLLQQGHSPHEVANSLGYEYYSTFYQQYIKRFNVPPNDIATRPSVIHKDLYFKETL